MYLGNGRRLPAPTPSSAARWKAAPSPAPPCPRCDSSNTKFCYYNNYSRTQPRYFCKGCRRYWTNGGTLRNVPVGGGCRRKNRHGASSNNHARYNISYSSVDTSKSGPTLAVAGPDLALDVAPPPPPVIDMAAMYNRYMAQEFYREEEEEMTAAAPVDRNFAYESWNDNYAAAEPMMESCYYDDMGSLSFGSSSPPPPPIELGDDLSSTTTTSVTLPESTWAQEVDLAAADAGDWSTFNQSSFEYNYLYTI